MNGLTGTGALVGLILRRDRLKLAMWVALQTLVVVGIAASFAQLYPTVESRQPLAAALMANPALSSLLGPLLSTSIGSLTAWRIGVFISALAGLVSSILVVRHTRAEEEAGRRELLGATVAGRQSGLAAALIVTLGSNLAGTILVAVGLVALRLPVEGSVALGLAFGVTGAVFAGVAAVAAQLTVSARSARGISILALGIAFLLRFIGDASGASGNLYWLTWVSPLGWAQHVRPFSGERWWVFALFLSAFVALCSAAGALSARRDLGAGAFALRPGPATASPVLGGPFGLAWRLQKSGLIAWSVVFAVGGLMLGAVATSVSDIANTSPHMKDLIARLLGEGKLIDMFFSETMGIAGLVAAAYAIQSTLQLRGEEEGQHAELVLATTVGRVRWASSHLAFSALGPAILLVAIGAGAGLSYGFTSGEIGRELARGVASALVQLPAIWVAAGLSVALFGLAPRFAGVIWVVLVAFLLLGQLGQLLRLSQWMLDVSPFTHVPKILLGDTASAPLLWLAALAVGLAALGLVGFSRRDVGRA